ncbi:MAG TPA: hypothetical protein VFC17_10880 [Candidatus Limnocylindrales bacterium]|nr:hypothetical protein [Candidatus Limnocylindrales bacterium]
MVDRSEQQVVIGGHASGDAGMQIKRTKAKFQRRFGHRGGGGGIAWRGGGIILGQGVRPGPDKTESGHETDPVSPREAAGGGNNRFAHSYKNQKLGKQKAEINQFKNQKTKSEMGKAENKNSFQLSGFLFSHFLLSIFYFGRVRQQLHGLFNDRFNIIGGAQAFSLRQTEFQTGQPASKSGENQMICGRHLPGSDQRHIGE